MKRTMMMKIGDTYKLWTEYMRSIALESGIPDSYRMVLTYLLYNPQANPKEIARYRNIRMSSVSQIVKEMERDGYLEKKTDATDQRYVRLTLTPKGQECARRLQEKVDAADARTLQLFGEEREQEIMDAMDELSRIITDNLSKHQ